MQNRIKQSLADLKNEYETGGRQLELIEERASQLRQTLLRISGAIQALEEMLKDEMFAVPSGQPED